jgi:hypothetical protein
MNGAGHIGIGIKPQQQQQLASDGVVLGKYKLNTKQTEENHFELIFDTFLCILYSRRENEKIMFYVANDLIAAVVLCCGEQSDYVNEMFIGIYIHSNYENENEISISEKLLV